MPPLRRPALIVLALSALSFAALIGWWPSAGADEPDAEYRLGGQILTRLRDDGRIEFCFRPEGQTLVCPHLRLLNLERAQPEQWVGSSEFRWQVPADADRIVYPTLIAPAQPDDSGCTPDFRRMFAAIWKVETTRSFATAFHIGGGRFITAHHAIERRPPFVSLIHGQRTVAAAVIGFDPEFDLALLEVEVPALVQDLPSLRLRAPTPADVGKPVYLIGYPGGEALTLHGGGVVAQVWDDVIQTSSASRGGTSGGPMFDECGDVIGVHWAGSSDWAYTSSGAALIDALERINGQWPSWPRVPGDLPAPLDAPGRLVWHYEAAPPAQVDCSELDAEWWIGLAGVGGELEVRADLERSGWRQIGVCGAEGPEDYDNGSTYIAALARAPIDGSGEAGVRCAPAVGGQSDVLYESLTVFGAARLIVHDETPLCDAQVDYRLRIDLDQPRSFGETLSATLIGRDGRLVVGDWAGKSYETASSAVDSPIVTFWQEWMAAADFEPVAFRVVLGSERWTIPIESAPRAESGLGSPLPEGAFVEQSGRIVVRVEEGGSVLRACLQAGSGAQICPESGVLRLDGLIPYRWRESPPLRWTAELPAEAVPELIHSRPRTDRSCAYQDSVQLSGWQLNTLAGTETAVYVGEGQFLVSRYRLPDTAPWGVVARGEIALPVIGVATDPRNDLALVEIFDPEAELDLGPPAVFGSTSEALIGADAHLVVYPEGSARRFTVAAVAVAELSERVLRVEPTGIRRHGGPLIDLCTGQLLGLALGGDDLLRAETVAASLAEMRKRIARPVFPQDGPPAHGSAAAYPQPLYAGAVQPEFSGRVCLIQPSERYGQRYAVYVSTIDNPDVWQVYEKDDERPQTCDFGDKIFIVEYRAEQPPSAVCIEPRRPLSPLSNVEWELEAPEGIALFLAREFSRNDCPGLSKTERTRWFSTHYFELRNTSEYDFVDLTVRVVNEAGKEFTPRRDRHSFADSDIWAWRVDVTEGEPVKVVVKME